MTLRLKILLGTLALLVAFVGGAKWHAATFTPPPPQVIVQKATEEGKKQTVVVEKIVEHVTQKDGTVTVREIERQRDTKQENKTVREKPSLVAQPKTSYSLDLRYAPSLTAAPSMRDVELEGGYRLGQSNAWITSGYSVKYNQFTVGLRYEF